MTESRRLSSLGDIQSDQESEASGQEIIQKTSSVKRRVRSQNMAARQRRTVSLQEATGTPVRNRNGKLDRAKSVTEKK